MIYIWNLKNIFLLNLKYFIKKNNIELYKYLNYNFLIKGFIIFIQINTDNFIKKL